MKQAIHKGVMYEFDWMALKSKNSWLDLIHALDQNEVILNRYMCKVGGGGGITYGPQWAAFLLFSC